MPPLYFQRLFRKCGTNLSRTRENVVKVIFMVGILDMPYKDPMWQHLEQEFKKVFPIDEAVVEHLFYLPWEFEKIRVYAKHVRFSHDTGDDVLIVGHSMGGVLACGIAPQFSKSRVRGVVTIFSPHTYMGGRFSLEFGAVNIAAPIVSFAATWDAWVPYGARHEKSREHVELKTDHVFGLVQNPQWSRIIARIAHKHCSGPG